MIRVKRTYTGALITFLFSILLLSGFSVASAGSFDGEEIRAIEVNGLTRITREEFMGMMCFSVGKKFDKESLKKCIRRAFKKDIFLDIQVDSERVSDGIKLAFNVIELPVINDIYINGNDKISKRKIMKVLSFDEGDDFREGLIQRSGKDIISFYRRKGFHDADVKVSFNESKNASRVDININIEEGAPLIIERIRMPDDALKRVRLSAGDLFDMDDIDKELKRLKKYYIKQGHIKPEIGPYEFSDGELYVPVHPGFILEVVFNENTVISDKNLLKEMPFKNSETVSDELIEEAISRLEGLYRSNGYHYVQVAAGLETFEDTIKVSFFIFEGEKVISGYLNFEGMSIDPETVKGMIPLQEDKIYSDTLLTESRDLIENFYNALGYINMKVVDIRKDFEDDGSTVNVTFEIDEGIQVRIDEINISGNRDIAVSEIIDSIDLQEDALFNLLDIGDARRRVLSLYKRYGYVDASVEVTSKINEDRAILHFNISEKNPSVLGKIVVRGNRKTKEKIIRREFTLDEGAPYNYDELLKIKQRIYKLGLFNEVSIDEFNPERLPYRTIRDVLVTVEEDEPGAVEIALGYGDYEEFRGSLDISYSNLGGYNRQIRMRAEVSSVEVRYMVNYIEPWLFNKRDLPFSASLIKEERKNVNIDTRDVLYEIDKLSVIVDVEKEFIEGLKANLSYEYSINEITDVDPGVILSKEDTGTVGIGSISTSLFYDTRDNPFDPSEGSINGIVLKFASEALLSETNFIKGTFQSAWFFKLFKRLVFATSFRGGVSYSFDEIDELPLVERFFLGGRTTARGYSHDTLGPKGIDDVPTGGNIFALINEEFRINVGKGIGLVVFADGGNVWQTTDDIDDEFKFTVGGGLRYITPVGPVRIDYGYKLDREPGESAGEIHFSFGHAF